MRYYNKIIGGIILIAIGIFIAAISNYTYTEAQTDLIHCQSTTDLNSPSPLECDTASIIFNASLIGFVIGILMTIIGLILLIVGIVKKKKSKIISRIQIPTEKPIDNLSKEQEIQSNIVNEEKIQDETSIAEKTSTAERINPKHYEHENENEKIYCRYCGKLRPLEIEYCARCGRSSISRSENMKKCISCNSLVSEDSGFCSSCGKEF